MINFDASSWYGEISLCEFPPAADTLVGIAPETSALGSPAAEPKL